ncbi:hypothetical protein B7R78_0022465 [Ralstonia solanacearum]|nr:hypothetical protein [Ralstonia solanacearum]
MYDGQRSGHNDARSDAGRGAVGAGSAPGQTGPLPAMPIPARLPAIPPKNLPDTRHPQGSKTASYLQPAMIPLAAAGA